MEDLSTLTFVELKDKSKTLGIPKYYTLNNNDLDDIDKSNKRKEIELEKEKQYEHAHCGKRNLNLLKQKGVEDLIDCLEYPFSFIEEYDLELSQIPGQPEEDIGNFPNNIKEYYWIFEGENDGNPWMTLCQLKNDVYVFYKGECDYTGFDCQGSMEIYASKNSSILIHQAMGNWDYDMYMKDVS